MGLVVANTIIQLSRRSDVQLTVGFIRTPTPAGRPVTEFALPSGVPICFDVCRRPLTRADLIRTALAGHLRSDERPILSMLRSAASNADAVLWIGDSWDPLVAMVPTHCDGKPAFLHCNDSIALFQRYRDSNAAWGVRCVVSARQERRVLRSGYCGVVYVSHVDASHAQGLLPGANAPSLAAIPNGIDVDLFAPLTAECVDAGGQFRLLFTGVMSYEPNVVAAEVLVREILPLIQVPVTLRLAGRDPSVAVQRLSSDPRVLVPGAVASMVDEYRSADLLVVPMPHTTGTKNKVLEALSCGLPVLTTRRVMDAFKRPILGTVLADSHDEFAAAIAALASDAQERRRLSRAARESMLAEYSWEARTGQLVDWLTSVVPQP